MKKIIYILLVLIMFAIPAFSQTMEMSESNNYKVYSEISKAHALLVATAMDEFFNLYNHYFHFDENNLESKLQIRLFKSQRSFDSYLSPIIKGKSTSNVFIQYKDSRKNELIIYTIDDSMTINKTLIHNGFVQFIKSFIKEPPLWLEKGFASYFEKSTYNNENNAVIFRDNSDWVIALKKYIAADRKNRFDQKLFPVSDLLSIDNSTANKNITLFNTESLGLISFLINSEYKRYNRILWDAISVIKPDMLRSENESNIRRTAFKWINANTLRTDFYYYVESIKTFSELVENGTKLYSDGYFDDAERIFISAISLEENSHIPYYYLGLINYTKKDYSMAEYYYNTAAKMGSDPNLIYYALGVNSYANKDYENSVLYLNKVETSEYLYKSDKLLDSINNAIEETTGVN